MKKVFLLLLGCAAMNAAVITFGSAPSGSSGGADNGSTVVDGNFKTWTSSEGWTVTARAFSVNAAGTSAFAPAALQAFGTSGGQSLGLGVCNSTASETGAGCSGDEWQVDNNGTARDFILLTFSQPVTVQSLLLLQSSLTSHDSDIDFYLDTTATLTIVSNVTTLATLGAQGFGAVNSVNGPTMADAAPFGCNNPGACPTSSISLGNVSGVYGLLIAAQAGETNDYFKVSALTATGVPEPGSIALLGGGLAALGLVARRRRRA